MQNKSFRLNYEIKIQYLIAFITNYLRYKYNYYFSMLEFNSHKHIFELTA